MNTAHIRFYEELNDFLHLEHQKQTVTYSFNGNPGIKDPIEALGVPASGDRIDCRQRPVCWLRLPAARRRSCSRVSGV